MLDVAKKYYKLKFKCENLYLISFVFDLSEVQEVLQLKKQTNEQKQSI